MQFNMRVGYQHPGLGDDLRPDPYRTVKIETAQWVGDLLARHYPGHAWMVEVVIQKGGGIIKMRLNGLMPPDRWYVCKMSDVLTDPGGRRTVLRGAGEILERYRIPRAGFDLDHWRVALNAIPLKAKLKGKGHLAPLLD